METPKVCYQIKEYAGTSYQPSNGTEGMIFMEAFCEQCIHDHSPSEKFCDILTESMCFSPGDKEYPKEWVYNEEGWPVCTKWQKWDWGDGYGGWNEPPETPYEPQDPNQLMLFSIADDILQDHKVVKEIELLTK